MALDDDEHPARAVLSGLGAMAAVAVVVGLVLGAVALGAARLTGIGAPADPGVTEEASLYIPSYEPTESSEEPGLPGRGSSPPATPRREPSEEPRPEARRRPAITLVAAPLRVAPGARINLSGVYRRGDRATLQVQRLEGGRWTDFPVTATVEAGRFDTWVQTSRTGRSPFRVLDPATARASNTVVVTVG